MNYLLIKASAFLRYGGIDRHPLLQGLSPSLVDAIAKRFCYSEAHGFTYQRISKSANSTIVRTLAAHVPDMPDLESDRHGRRAKSILRNLPTPAQFEASYAFTFVRNPTERVVSAWLDKAFHPNYQKRYGLYDPANKGNAVSLSDFLARLEDGLLSVDLHWCPQAEIVIGEGKPFDRVARVDDIDTALPEIMEEIFGTFKGISVATKGRTGARNSMNDLLSAADRARIDRLYARDFELFFPEAR